MNSITRYLIEGEPPKHVTRRHGMMLAVPATQAGLAMLVALLLSPREGATTLSNIAWLLAAPFVLRLLWKVLNWMADRIVITDKRVVEISGLIVRKVAMMPLKRVTDLTYERPLLGRLFGYGEVTLESAGQDQALTKLTYLPDPDEFYKMLTDLVITDAPMPVVIQPVSPEPGPPPAPSTAGPGADETGPITTVQ